MTALQSSQLIKSGRGRGLSARPDPQAEQSSEMSRSEAVLTSSRGRDITPVIPLNIGFRKKNCGYALTKGMLKLISCCACIP